SRGAFGRRSGFAPAKIAQSFDDAGERPRGCVLAAEIVRFVKLDHLVELFAWGGGDHVEEDIIEMEADETLQVIERKGFGYVFGKHVLDCRADVLSGVQQRTVNVEDVNAECWNGGAVRQAPDAPLRTVRAGGVHPLPAELPAGCFPRCLSADGLSSWAEDCRRR